MREVKVPITVCDSYNACQEGFFFISDVSYSLGLKLITVSEWNVYAKTDSGQILSFPISYPRLATPLPTPTPYRTPGYDGVPYPTSDGYDLYPHWGETVETGNAVEITVVHRMLDSVRLFSPYQPDTCPASNGMELALYKEALGSVPADSLGISLSSAASSSVEAAVSIEILEGAFVSGFGISFVTGLIGDALQSRGCSPTLVYSTQVLLNTAMMAVTSSWIPTVVSTATRFAVESAGYSADTAQNTGNAAAFIASMVTPLGLAGACSTFGGGMVGSFLSHQVSRAFFGTSAERELAR